MQSKDNKGFRQLRLPYHKPRRPEAAFWWLAGIALAVLWIACVVMAYNAHKIKTRLNAAASKAAACTKAPLLHKCSTLPKTLRYFYIKMEEPFLPKAAAGIYCTDYVLIETQMLSPFFMAQHFILFHQKSIMTQTIKTPGFGSLESNIRFDDNGLLIPVSDMTAFPGGANGDEDYQDEEDEEDFDDVDLDDDDDTETVADVTEADVTDADAEDLDDDDLLLDDEDDEEDDTL